jgi:AIPR protein
MNNTIIIKLQDSNNLQESKQHVKINKLVSSISPLDFIKLLKNADNKVNPRSAKTNKITKSIHETLEISPELFWLKSKGILLATENCKLLDRNRVNLSFDNLDFEGIMDGGHNTFAIASFLIEKLFDKKLKDWDECKSFWNFRYDEILEEYNKNYKKILDFSIPIEIIFPNEEDGALDEFYNYIAEICAARNNNVQLTETSKGNQVGLYDHLQKNLDRHFDIVWRAGTPGVIKSEDVLSMSSIPLLFLQENKLLPKDLNQLNPVSIYSQKSRCVDFFNAILEHKEVSTENKGKFALHDSYVESGLDMAEDIMRFFDKLFVEFPRLYNRISPGFGRIKSVDDGTKGKNKPNPKPTLFRTKKSVTSYPFGFIYPLITGISELIEIDTESKKLNWIISPMAINLEELDMTQYIDAIKLANYDPQRVGKENLFYSQAKSIFETYVLRKVSRK